MKATALAIARAVVHVGMKLPKEELPALLDATASFLIAHGLMKAARTFPVLLEREWLKQEGVVSVKLTTVAGHAGKAKDDILAILQGALKQGCLLEERADPAIRGGLLLTVGDERFDCTLRGALTELASRLTQPIPLTQA